MRQGYREVIGAFSLGFVLGLLPFIAHEFLYVRPLFSQVEHRANSTSSYTFINPLLECTDSNTFSGDVALTSLETKIEKFISMQQRTGSVTLVSVYYRDLNNGPWFGLRESQPFFPASLLKVPLALSFYVKDEMNPGVLEKKILYTPDESLKDVVQPYESEKKLEAGKSYSIKELIEHMLKASSNEAVLTLSAEAGVKQIESTYRDFDLPLPKMGQDYETDVHTYASFFRILYNATYVSRKDSNELLEMLTKVTFTEGLVAGVPTGLQVAHKFGSRKVEGYGATLQLHDCGIVYEPNRPYILCVMTQGSDFSKQADTIKTISTMLYTEVDARSRGGGRH